MGGPPPPPPTRWDDFFRPVVLPRPPLPLLELLAALTPPELRFRRRWPCLCTPLLPRTRRDDDRTRVPGVVVLAVVVVVAVVVDVVLVVVLLLCVCGVVGAAAAEVCVGVMCVGERAVIDGVIVFVVVVGGCGCGAAVCGGGGVQTHYVVGVVMWLVFVLVLAVLTACA